MTESTIPTEFTITLGALCDEYGIPIDAPRTGGLATFSEAELDYPAVLSQDTAGNWHVHTYDDLLPGNEWEPSDEQAAQLYSGGEPE